MPRLLVVRSSFDIATKYLSSYAAKIVEQAPQWNVEVIDLYGADATLQNFEAKISDCDLFFGFGHANKDVFTGQNLEVILKASVNADELTNKKAYIAGCQAGVTLGPAAVKAGCPEFYSYQSDFTFVYDPTAYNNNDVLNDVYAQAFFDSALTTGYAILAGKTPKEVFDDTINRYDYWYDYWKKQNDPLADDVMTWLNWDRQGFIAITPNGLYTEPKTPSLLTAGIILPLGAAALLLLLSRE